MRPGLFSPIDVVGRVSHDDSAANQGRNFCVPRHYYFTKDEE